MNAIKIESSVIHWIDDAVGYGNVSTIGAAYKKLLSMREIMKSERSILIMLKDPLQIETAEGFDEWVRGRYSVFRDDPLHPVFNETCKDC